jgi:hypothetical protein
VCPHFQQLPKWASRVAFPGPWIKVMDPGRGIGARFPGKRIVGRWYLPDEDRFIQQGAQGADEYFLHLWEHYAECREDLAAYESVNEPACNHIGQVDVLASFLSRWITLMHDAGFKTAVPAFSMGNPDMWVVPVLRDVWERTDYATLHEYSHAYFGEPETPFLALRHRLIYERMAELGIRQPPLLVTEAGLDRGGDGYRKKPGQTPWPQYLEQLVAYEREIEQDSYVTAAFLFTSGATQTWRSFDLGAGEWNDLCKALT